MLTCSVGFLYYLVCLGFAKHLRQQDMLKSATLFLCTYLTHDFWHSNNGVFRKADNKNEQEFLHFTIMKNFILILENFRQCLIQRTLGELPIFEVMTWQLCNLLRSTLNCLQGTLILLQRYEFYLYIKSTVLFIMSLRQYST